MAESAFKVEPMESLEKKFKCPYCFERISFILDLSTEGLQTYVEDCEVCCQPIQVSFDSQEGKLVSFQNQKAY